MDLSVDIGGHVLEHPIMNAAGMVKTLPDVEKMAARSSVSVVLAGSGTVQSRDGNPGKNYHSDKWYSLNAWGLPNPGLQYYDRYLHKMRQAAHDAGKKFGFSIAGFSPDDYELLAQMVAASETDILEVNLGCPNVRDADGERKPIICFDPVLTGEILYCVANVSGPTGPVIWVKLSPYSNPSDRYAVAEEIKKNKRVKGVTNCNTYPDGSAFDGSGKFAIAANNGFGGISGPALKPIGLGQTRHLRQILPDSIHMIGAGGVGTGRDAKDYSDAGASVIQIGSAFLRDSVNPDYGVFGRVLDQMTDLF